MSRIPISATAQQAIVAPIAPVTDQNIDSVLSPDSVTVIAIARRDRFPNLCSIGILPRRQTGLPINPDDVAVALSFLGRCRKTKIPSFHTHDLQGHVGVGVGAIIAAAIGLGFTARGWYGSREFYPHALIGVNRHDVRKALA